MGKGNRARIQRAQNKLDNPQNYVEKKQAPKWVGTAIVLFIVVLLALSLTLNALYDSGALMRSSTAMKTENYTISGTMLSYFFNSQYSTFMNTYGNYASMLGLDSSLSLKVQPCSMLSDGGTWYDYFMNSTTSYVNELLICCEYAKANGLALDDEDKAEIDEAIETLATTAFEANYSLNGYLTAMYGSGVKEKDIRSAMEMILLANKAAVDANDKLKATVTEDEIQKYYEENPATFLKADYIVKNFEAELETLDKDDYDTDAEYEAAVSAAKEAYETEKAELLAKAKEYEATANYGAFWDKLTADITAEYDGYYDADASLTEEEREAKEKSSIASAMEAAMVDGYAYQDPTAENASDFVKWIFAEDRVIGDITVIEDEDEDEGTYTVSAYCVSSTAMRDEYTTVNMAYAMFPAAEAASSTAAAALKDKLVAAGVTTADAFKSAMADQTTSGSATIDNLLMDSFGYDSVDEYLYADGRKAGDCEVINCGTDYIAVVVYLGEGDVAWHATAKNGVLSEKMDTWYEDLAETYTVETNEKALNKISA